MTVHALKWYLELSQETQVPATHNSCHSIFTALKWFYALNGTALKRDCVCCTYHARVPQERAQAAYSQHNQSDWLLSCLASLNSTAVVGDSPACCNTNPSLLRALLAAVQRTSCEVEQLHPICVSAEPSLGVDASIPHT